MVVVVKGICIENIIFIVFITFYDAVLQWCFLIETQQKTKNPELLSKHFCIGRLFIFQKKHDFHDALYS